jgi:hypothetical protein
VEKTGLTMGEGFRWVTVIHPDHPELEVTLMLPRPPLDDQPAVEFSQPPADRPYGRGGHAGQLGNWLALVEQKDFRPEDFG